jgi:peptidoglycan/xylan/chitin deacetylase (PgdA/CDA1 family)
MWHVNGRPSERGLRILYWHRIAASHDQLAVHPTRFRREMELIHESGQRVVDLYSLSKESLDTDDNMLALTFDDGYQDFVDEVLPELQRRRWPATVFVVPWAVDGRVRFSWYRQEEHPRLLSWDEMRDIERTGLVHFEPHSLSHPYLPDETDESAWREIAGSKAAVEEKLHRPARLFCYPGGFFTHREIEMVERAGFAAAYGCEYGANRRTSNWYRLRRTIVDKYDSDLVFAARLAGGTDRGPLGRATRSVGDDA